MAKNERKKRADVADIFANAPPFVYFTKCCIFSFLSEMHPPVHQFIPDLNLFPVANFLVLYVARSVCLKRGARGGGISSHLILDHNFHTHAHTFPNQILPWQ